jgi:hypothetical protein
VEYQCGRRARSAPGDDQICADLVIGPGCFTHLAGLGYNASNSLEASAVRKLLSAALLFTSMVLLSAIGFAQAPPAPNPDKPYVMEYYYKTHWGHQEEFLDLFKKNHYPVLQKEIAQGRILSIRLDTPAYHMPEQERWDYRVTITFKNAQAAFTPVDEHAIQLQLYPDQASFRREEQRRFEILEAHWDLSISQIELDKK